MLCRRVLLRETDAAKQHDHEVSPEFNLATPKYVSGFLNMLNISVGVS